MPKALGSDWLKVDACWVVLVPREIPSAVYLEEALGSFRREKERREKDLL